MDASIHTDLYQLTMVAGYFHRQMTGSMATCEMFVRRLPERRKYLVVMGVSKVIDYLEKLHFSEESTSYLKQIPGIRDAMTPEFEDFLRDFKFTGDVDAMLDGTIAFANEPIIRIRAPLAEAQLVETFILSTINHATSVATKAARIVKEAGHARCVEFGTRRTHPEAAVDAAYAACRAGFVGTSNVAAGMKYGLNITGTAAHMWTMAHSSEEDAFRSYAEVFPNSCILLIDTYDTEKGAERAAKIAREKLAGVRLDSGDLLVLSRAVRQILDSHGLQKTEIVASGDLNEYKIRSLREAGAPIDVYGIGTDLVACIDAPALGGVYKLVELDGRPTAKFSEYKSTLPGPHQVIRIQENGHLRQDTIVLEDETLDFLGPPGVSALLEPVMRAGCKTMDGEITEIVQNRVRLGLDSLPKEILDIACPFTCEFKASISTRLQSLQDRLRASFRK